MKTQYWLLLYAVFVCLGAELSAQTYVKQLLHQSESYPGALLATGDFDGDGDLDHLHSRSVRLCENGAVVETIFWDTSYEPTEVYVADVNNDGVDDFLCRLIDSVFLFTNEGSGSFSISLIGTINNARILGLIDVDADSDLDFILQSPISTSAGVDIVFWRNEGGSGIWMEESLGGESSFSEVLTSALLADIDLDGDPELCLAYQDSLKLFKLEDESLFFKKAWQISLGSNIYSNQLYAFDSGDGGMMDLIIADTYGTRLYQCDSTANSLQEAYSFDQGAQQIRSADVNRDGIDDLLLLSGNTGSWRLSTASLSYEDPIPLDPDVYLNSFCCHLAVLDHDQDSWSNLMLSQREAQTILTQTFEDNQQSWQIYFYDMLADMDQNTRILPVDLNNDDRVDLLLADLLKQSMVVFWQEAGGDFSAPELLFETEDELKSFDFRRASDSLAVQIFYLTAHNEIWLAGFTEEGLFQDQLMIQEVANYDHLQMVDINGDARPDPCLTKEEQINFLCLMSQGEDEFEASNFTIHFTTPNGQVAALDRAFADWDYNGEVDYLMLSRNFGELSLDLVPNNDTFDQPEIQQIVHLGQQEANVRAFDVAMAHGLFPYWYSAVLLDAQLKVFRHTNDGIEMLCELDVFNSAPTDLKFVSDCNQDAHMDILLSDALLLSNTNATAYEYLSLNLDESIGEMQAIVLGDEEQEIGFVGITQDQRLLLYGLDEGLKVRKPDQSEFVLYPNPVSSLINLTLPNQDPISQIQIFNMQAQLEFQKAIHGHSNIKLDLAHLPAGVYHCVIETKHDSYCKKFVLLE